jgi:hypothetical protein
MNPPISKFASVYKGKVPFCQWRILYDNHSFVHSIGSGMVIFFL